MRLFVAIDLSEEVRRNLSALGGELSAAIPGARWIRAEAMHLTLKFIGHVADDGLRKIEASLATIRSPAPVELRFQGIGCFPSARRPQVLWAGIISSRNLAEIASEIERHLEPLGIPREDREFRPHLTLARFKQGSVPKSFQNIVSGLAAREFGTMTASEFHLYQSHLRRSGAEYARLASYRFVSTEKASV